MLFLVFLGFYTLQYYFSCVLEGILAVRGATTGPPSTPRGPNIWVPMCASTYILLRHTCRNLITENPQRFEGFFIDSVGA